VAQGKANVGGVRALAYTTGLQSRVSLLFRPCGQLRCVDLGLIMDGLDWCHGCVAGSGGDEQTLAQSV
jgi:hypothetical protein